MFPLLLGQIVAMTGLLRGALLAAPRPAPFLHLIIGGLELTVQIAILLAQKLLGHIVTVTANPSRGSQLTVSVLLLGINSICKLVEHMSSRFI